MANKLQQKNEGFALLLAIVVSGIILAIGLTMLSVTVKQLTLSSVARESEIAFHAASAGLECASYIRVQNPSSHYTDPLVASGNIAGVNQFDCFGVTASQADEDQFAGSFAAGQNYINHFYFEYEWGTGAGGFDRCSRIDLYVMNAGASNYNYNFSSISSAIGNSGSKTCNQNDICSIAITKGYNLSCTDLAAGLVTVERELTAEF